MYNGVRPVMNVVCIFNVSSSLAFIFQLEIFGEMSYIAFRYHLNDFRKGEMQCIHVC